MQRNRFSPAMIATCAVLSAAGLRAQNRGGSIAGIVTDAGHYMLAGAKIDLEPKGPSTVSDQQGRFALRMCRRATISSRSATSDSCRSPRR
jgi:hypothetical protein